MTQLLQFEESAISLQAATDRVPVAIKARRPKLAQHPSFDKVRGDIAPHMRHLVARRYLMLHRITDPLLTSSTSCTIGKSTAMWSHRRF
jgi:hypothetical protein